MDPTAPGYCTVCGVDERPCCKNYATGAVSCNGASRVCNGDFICARGVAARRAVAAARARAYAHASEWSDAMLCARMSACDRGGRCLLAWTFTGCVSLVAARLFNLMIILAVVLQAATLLRCHALRTPTAALHSSACSSPWTLRTSSAVRPCLHRAFRITAAAQTTRHVIL